MKFTNSKKLLQCLKELYSASDALNCFEKLRILTDNFQSKTDSLTKRRIISHEDSCLMVYPNTLRNGENSSLSNIQDFLQHGFGADLSSVHILPFFEADGDFGFQVKNYYEVDSDFGDWDDIQSIANSHDLMIDLVCNHVSSSSDWFEKFSKGVEFYKDFFILYNSNFDHSKVTTCPNEKIYSSHQSESGEIKLWCRYSDDQLDLNYKNWRVLYSICEVLLTYAKLGAKYIRLDAIAYVWKKSGTNCVNLPENQTIVKIFRMLLDFSYPTVSLVVEVPYHPRNHNYLDGDNGAQLSYDYNLPVLINHSLISGDASYLVEYLRDRRLPTSGDTPINVLSTHDGLFLMPFASPLPSQEIDVLVDAARRNDGTVYYRDMGAEKHAYECNISIVDLLNTTELTDKQNLDKLLAGISIILSLPGLPLIYANLLLNARNDFNQVGESGDRRAINRRTFDLIGASFQHGVKHLDTDLVEPVRKLLNIRRNNANFGPESSLQVLSSGKEVLIFKRGISLLVVVNVTAHFQQVSLPNGMYIDEISGHWVGGAVYLHPFQSMWLSEKLMNEPVETASNLEVSLFEAYDDLKYEAYAYRFCKNDRLTLDFTYRRNHLPLVAASHPDIVSSDEETDYVSGRYDHPRISLVAFLPRDLLLSNDNYVGYLESLQKCSFSSKINWDIHNVRSLRLHATICGRIQEKYNIQDLDSFFAEIEKMEPFKIRVYGPWMNASRNVGRLYLPLASELIRGIGAFERMQMLMQVPSTKFYAVGVHQFTDSLSVEETLELETLLDSYRGQKLVDFIMDEVSIIKTHDDLILESEILKNIHLHH